jgi:hypothetical protein
MPHTAARGAQAAGSDGVSFLNTAQGRVSPPAFRSPARHALSLQDEVREARHAFGLGYAGQIRPLRTALATA